MADWREWSTSGSPTRSRDTTSSMDSDCTAVAMRMLRRAEVSGREDGAYAQDQYMRRLDSLRVCSSPAHSSGARRTAMARTMNTSGSARTFDGSTAVCLLYKSSYAEVSAEDTQAYICGTSVRRWGTARS